MNNEEAKILNELKQGNKAAYEFLFRTYYIPLCIYAQRYLKRKDLAEDIVSDTFFNIWKNRRKIEIRLSLNAYLYQAVSKNSLNHLRKKKKEQSLEDYHLTQSGDSDIFFKTDTEIPSDVLYIKELGEKIREGIEKLPPQQQTTFKLKRYEDRKNKDIAEIMGVSVKTVEMHFSLALLSLRNHLKDYMP